MLGKLNTEFILALVKRDLWKYFTNPTGYVFITLFIFMSAAAAFWQDRFFLNNLANLDHLNDLFPYLLVFFVPALTMAVWAEERKNATDELLLTLPATSLEVVLGKYVAVLGVYAASLALSLSHVLVLFWLGSPDLGLVIGNYFGYFLVGMALIALGMLASCLTANATIAFVLGSLFCATLVFLDQVAGLVSPWLARAVAPLGVVHHFQDFARGVISFSGLLFFLSIASIALFVNVLLVDRRHWPNELEGRPTWIHHSVRAVAMAIGALAMVVLLGRTGLRLDTTSERLHSMSRETRQLIGTLEADRPVFIQAFISPEVPESQVQSRTNLLDMLREFDALGGSTIQVRIEDTEPFTEVAREAREKFGIVPREIPVLASARAGFASVFMGLAITRGAEEQVIPFMDRGLSSEYELARSIRVVARTERKKVGVLDTEIKLFGGLDFQTFQSTPPWPVVEELKKQYEVVQVSKGSEYPADLDGLMVALPSSLPQAELDRLESFIQSGKPTLLMVDPLPLANLGLAPVERPGADRNPFQQQGPPPEEKGDIQGLVSRLGIRWDASAIVWDSYNPHPDLEYLPPEVVFVGRGSGNPDSFNAANPASAGLQEAVLLYPGLLESAGLEGVEFTPLLTTGTSSGRFSYFQMIQRNFFGAQLNRNLPHRPDPMSYVLAAHVRKTPATDSEVEGSENASSAEGGLNVVVIADLDFISEQFFQIRQQGPANLNFDNVNLFLNSMDTLIGDESFIALRNKRVRHRTLTRVEAQTQDFITRRVAEEQEAEAEADKALADAQQRLNERVAEVSQRSDLDQRTKQIMARNLQEVENRRFEVLKSNIESRKEGKVAASKENMEAQLRRIQSGIKTFAVLLPPIPVIVMGILIFLRRQKREREAALAAHRLRG